MKLLAAAFLLLAAANAPPNEPALNAFRYDRQVLSPAISPQNASPNACATLDANVFAHTSPGLADLRLLDSTGKLEIPYVVTVSNTSPTSDAARIFNAIPSNAATGKPQLNLDLEMPHRPYSQVDLTFQLKNFVASAHVLGLRTLNDPHPVFLGDIPLFDLTAQNLGSGTSLPIAESTFPYLHLRLTFQPAPQSPAPVLTPSTVASAQVPPARQAQTLYTGIAQSFASSQSGNQSGNQTITTFAVPAHVPIERVSFDLDPAETANFSRPVVISATLSATLSATSPGNGTTETLSGAISRVSLHLGDRQIQQESLSIPAILAANAQAPATVTVAIQNGAQPPLKIRSVRLEMRQRQLCFPAATTQATLAYGASLLRPPTYDFARTFNAAAPVRRAMLLHEHTNSFFVAPATRPSGLERYPALLWLALLLAAALAAVLIYSAIHRRHRDSLRR
jgi:hypothetical protein